jgi:hypothetical protein
VSPFMAPWITPARKKATNSGIASSTISWYGASRP